MNGADLAHKVNDLYPGMAMILCTALADWHGRAESAAGLFSTVLQKPLEAGALAAAVAKCVNTQQGVNDDV